MARLSNQQLVILSIFVFTTLTTLSILAAMYSTAVSHHQSEHSQDSLNTIHTSFYRVWNAIYCFVIMGTLLGNALLILYCIWVIVYENLLPRYFG
jgi:hypothetical protein